VAYAWLAACMCQLCCICTALQVEELATPLPQQPRNCVVYMVGLSGGGVCGRLALRACVLVHTLRS
jgi:hypothetical protein